MDPFRESLAKAATGEPGDKRNTKYALAGLGGYAVGVNVGNQMGARSAGTTLKQNRADALAAMQAHTDATKADLAARPLPQESRRERKARLRHNKDVKHGRGGMFIPEPKIPTAATYQPTFKTINQINNSIKGTKAIHRGGEAGAVIGAATGLAAYGAYRANKRSKVTKAMSDAEFRARVLHAYATDPDFKAQFQSKVKEKKKAIAAHKVKWQPQVDADAALLERKKKGPHLVAKYWEGTPKPEHRKVSFTDAALGAGTGMLVGGAAAYALTRGKGGSKTTITRTITRTLKPKVSRPKRPKVTVVNYKRKNPENYVVGDRFADRPARALTPDEAKAADKTARATAPNPGRTSSPDNPVGPDVRPTPPAQIAGAQNRDQIVRNREILRRKERSRRASVHPEDQVAEGNRLNQNRPEKQVSNKSPYPTKMTLKEVDEAADAKYGRPEDFGKSAFGISKGVPRGAKGAYGYRLKLKSGYGKRAAQHRRDPLRFVAFKEAGKQTKRDLTMAEMVD